MPEDDLSISWSTQDIRVLTLFPSFDAIHHANYHLVPHNADPSAVVQHIVPYLKEGKHGPGGDFDLDPDRATGKGHNYHPGDAKLYQEYLEQRAAFRKLHPTYPKLKEGEHVDDEMKADRDMWETWYYGFREKYPGTRGDQWVCGCSALIEESGDESEEE
jgi:hypothetical protein